MTNSNLLKRSSFTVFYQILLHEHGSEYWFQYNLNPSKGNALYIDTNTNDGISGSKVILKYKVEENVPRKNYICNPKETMRSYTQCAFDKLVINGCTKSINKIGGSFNETNICRNVSVFLEKQKSEHEQLKSILYPEENDTIKCVKPCKTTSFDVTFEKMHKNIQKFNKRGNKDKDVFYLNICYNEFVIETKQEYFLMDLAGLMSTVGGFLGLFLGSSCVSIIDWIGNHFKKCME